MRRVLMVLSDLSAGNGIASAIMAYYAGLIDAGFEVDFLLSFRKPVKWENTLKCNRSDILYMERSPTRISVKTCKSIEKALNHARYDIVHVNNVGASAAQVLKLADRHGITCRIWHSHNTIYQRKLHTAKGLFNYLCDQVSLRYANAYIACSQLAGETRFPNKEFSLLHNCIDAEAFSFNEEKRILLRHDNSISDDAFVIGTVARMAKQKNPFFSLQVFEEVRRLCPSAVFVWIGDGEMRHQIEAYVSANGLDDAILLLGEQNDVAGWYSAMDCFLLPSYFEGLPVAGVEAQTAGLPIYASTMVPSDSVFSPYMQRLSLEDTPEKWAKKIVAEHGKERTADAIEYTRASGFDIATQYDALARAYEAYLEELIS